MTISSSIIRLSNLVTMNATVNVTFKSPVIKNDELFDFNTFLNSTNIEDNNYDKYVQKVEKQKQKDKLSQKGKSPYGPNRRY